MNIQLQQVEREQWEALARRCARFNLLQSWHYGEAKERVEGWTPVRTAILRQDEPIGLVQVLTRKWSIGGGLARINRGPLIFPEISRPLGIDGVEGALQALGKEWVNEHHYLLSIVPELAPGDDSERMLGRLGFVPASAHTPWSSAVLDLSLSLDQLRTNLHGKWRNLLNKSERMGLELERGTCGESLQHFLEMHRGMQEAKGFSGIGDSLVQALVRSSPYQGSVQVLFARSHSQRISGILVVGHSDSCTYLMGWNTPEGRQADANYYLLWSAFSLFKAQGYRWFDLGGINDETAPGVAHFKRGIRGQEYTVLGEHLSAPTRALTLTLAKLVPALSRLYASRAFLGAKWRRNKPS